MHALAKSSAGISSPQYGKLQIFCVSFFFVSASPQQPERTGQFSCLIDLRTLSDARRHKNLPFRGLIEEKCHLAVNFPQNATLPIDMAEKSKTH